MGALEGPIGCGIHFQAYKIKQELELICTLPLYYSYRAEKSTKRKEEKEEQ
jgi:hypothetical protein